MGAPSINNWSDIASTLLIGELESGCRVSKGLLRASEDEQQQLAIRRIAAATQCLEAAIHERMRGG